MHDLFQSVMLHNYGNATRFIIFFYAMLILHDECIKNVPLKGLTWGARDTLLRNSSILRFHPAGDKHCCWDKATLAGEEPSLHPILSGNCWE